jgi:hypothetical protein
MDKLTVIEHNNQRVLTTQQLAEFYETDVNRISQNYIRNIGRYQQGIHNYKLDGEELKQFKADYQIDSVLFANSIMLWTEKGALLHAKSLNTDKAWDVYDELVETYFRATKGQAIDTSKLSEQLQMFMLIGQAVAQNELALKNVETIALQAKEETAALKETIKETFTADTTENWREWVEISINKLVKCTNMTFQEVRTESYIQLESDARCKLSARVLNARKRLEDAGQRKSVISAYNKISAIEEDAKLKSIYTNIIQRMIMKYAA